MLPKRLLQDEAGQGASEYALLLAGVVVMVIFATSMFADDVQALWVSIGSYMQRVL